MGYKNNAPYDLTFIRVELSDTVILLQYNELALVFGGGGGNFDFQREREREKISF